MTDFLTVFNFLKYSVIGIILFFFLVKFGCEAYYSVRLKYELTIISFMSKKGEIENDKDK